MNPKQALEIVGMVRSHNEDAVAMDANPNWRACADSGFRHE